MTNCRMLVVDISDTAVEEQNQLNCVPLFWELVSVVSLPLCRRAYFKKKIPEPSQSEHEVVEQRVIGEDGKMRIEGPEPQTSESQPEWTKNPNGGYYWTWSTDGKMQLVHVFGGQYSPVEHTKFFGVNGHRFFWGPIPESPSPT